MKRVGVVEKYRSRLELPAAPAVTLMEGDTPLIPMPGVAEALGGGFELYAKFEGLNPTGSFKDRGMTAALTEAAHRGARAVICASTGNTAASAAAYAVRAGMTCLVLIPEGKVAMGKLAGAIAYGARVIQIKGSFDDGLRLVRALSERTEIALVNSVNPARIQGQKTAAFEIVEALGDAPDWLCLPVGNAGNITAYWLGFREDHAAGNASQLPRVLGVQAEGAAPLLRGHPVSHPETVCTAIRIGNPARWAEAEAALSESGGDKLAVSDAQILHMYRLAARLDGVFCEPSSAAGLAGLADRICHGQIEVKGKRVVAVLTGHGLKDPDAVFFEDPPRHPIVTLEPTLEALMDEVEG